MRSGRSRRERVRKADEAQSHGLGHAVRRVGAQQHLDLVIDAETVCLDLAIGQTELGRQVHAGRHDLQLEARRIAYRGHQPTQQPIFGAAARDDANPCVSWLEQLVAAVIAARTPAHEFVPSHRRHAGARSLHRHVRP